MRSTEASADWGDSWIGQRSYSPRIGWADTSGAMTESAKTSGLKSIISPCPIHPDCAIEVIFGPEQDGRIPFPDPALQPMAEHDFPGLVPIEARHLSRKRRALVGVRRFSGSAS